MAGAVLEASGRPCHRETAHSSVGAGLHPGALVLSQPLQSSSVGRPLLALPGHGVGTSQHLLQCSGSCVHAHGQPLAVTLASFHILPVRASDHSISSWGADGGGTQRQRDPK